MFKALCNIIIVEPVINVYCGENKLYLTQSSGLFIQVVIKLFTHSVE